MLSGVFSPDLILMEHFLEVFLQRIIEEEQKREVHYKKNKVKSPSSLSI